MPTPGMDPVARPASRKRCANCFALFSPYYATRNRARFCSDACRKEFHWHGSAFGPVKVRLEKIIAERVRELKETIADLERRIKRLESR